MLPVILDQVMELFQAGGAALITPDPSSGDYTVEIARGGFEPVLHQRCPCRQRGARARAPIRTALSE